jgi:hypothetical protein
MTARHQSTVANLLTFVKAATARIGYGVANLMKGLVIIITNQPVGRMQKGKRLLRFHHL